MVSLALVGLTLFVFAAVRHFEFVNWDDPSYITENPNVRAGLTWHSVAWALTTGYSPYWHPMTWLSHLLDIQIYGFDAGGHHVTNLIIHAATTVLLFLLLRTMTGAAGRSAFVAAIFAVHPLHVESVAWIAERKDVLSTFFWVLTIHAYLRYVRQPRWPPYAGVIVFYALALMSKPMVVTLPFVLALLDVWPLRRVESVPRRRLVLEKLPLLALAMATSVSTVIIQKRVGAVAGLDVLPWHARAANALVGYVAYLWKAIWPAHLAAFYPYHAFSPWLVLAAAAALAAVTAVAVRYRHTRPYLLIGWLWYLVTLAPVIGLVQAGEQAMADRFMYVPIIGLLIVIAWGVPDVVDWVLTTVRRKKDATGITASRGITVRLKPDATGAKPDTTGATPDATGITASRGITVRLKPDATGITAVAAILLCAITARAQVAQWADSVTLWRHAAGVVDDNYIAFENLGQALRERGQLDAARDSYTRALALAPAGSPAYKAVIHNSLGLVATRQEHTAEAIAHFDAAVRFNPGFVEPRINLANALAAEGQTAGAIEHYAAAIRLKPELTEAHVGLGSALLSQGRAAEAIPHYKEALRLDPGLAQAHNGLGGALAVEGHDAEAMAQYREALRLKPDLVTAHFNTALLLMKQGNIADARRHLESALGIDPGYEPARQALARIASRSGGM